MENTGKSTSKLKTELTQLKEELQHTKNELEKEKLKRKTIRHHLKERKKELHCHNILTEIFHDQTIDTEKAMVQILKVIPSSWQFPKIAEAQIIIGEAQFQTPGYRESKYQLKEQIVVSNELAGEITVAYPKGEFSNGKNAFIPEETDLLKSIAARLGKFLSIKNTTQKLHETAAHYHGVVEASPDVLLKCDLAGRIEFVSKRGRQMFGYPEDENEVGRSIFEFFVDSEHTRAAQDIEVLLTKGHIEARQFTALKADGSTFPIESVGEVVRNENGTPTGFLYSIRDISATKRLEESLVESERMLTNMMDNMPGVVYRCLNNKEWTMLFMSAGCKELTGYQSKLFTGDIHMPYNDVIHPEDRFHVAETVAKGLKRENKFEVNYRIVTADGEIKHVWEKGQGVVGDGKVKYIEGLILDISERFQLEQELYNSEKRFRSFFEDSNEILVILENGIITNFNNNAVVEFGKEFSQQMLGKTPLELTQNASLSAEEAQRKFENVMRNISETGSSELTWDFNLNNKLVSYKIVLSNLEANKNMLIAQCRKM